MAGMGTPSKKTRKISLMMVACGIQIAVFGTAGCTFMHASAPSESALENAHKIASSEEYLDRKVLVAHLNQVRPPEVSLLLFPTNACDADVIRTMACIAPDARKLSITYHADAESWELRHLMPNSQFKEFLGYKPNIYECLMYLHVNMRIGVYYLVMGDEIRILIMDTLSGETREELLPQGVSQLPVDHLVGSMLHYRKTVELGPPRIKKRND